MIEGKELFAANLVAEVIEGSALGQALHAVALDDADGNAFGKVEDVMEGTIGVSLLDDGIDGTGTQTGYGSQSEADVSVRVYAELVATEVDTGA